MNNNDKGNTIMKKISVLYLYIWYVNWVLKDGQYNISNPDTNYTTK